jgi:hypothetical protein
MPSWSRSPLNPEDPRGRRNDAVGASNLPVANGVDDRRVPGTDIGTPSLSILSTRIVELERVVKSLLVQLRNAGALERAP